MAVDIDDWNDRYGQPKPSPSPTGINNFRRKPPVNLPLITSKYGPAPVPTNLPYVRKKGAPAPTPNLLGGFGDFISTISKGHKAPLIPNMAAGFGGFLGGLIGKQNLSPVKRQKGQMWKTNPFGGINASSGQDLPGGGGIEDPRSFSDILHDVQAMLSEMGVGGSVSYDPLREQARGQWQDADARTLAMFNQLQDSIRGEAAPLGAAYDEGVASTNAATEFANTQNAQSAQNIGSMVNQQAGALGIQEAVANDLNAGNLSGQDQAARTADTTARGQITSNQLISNKVGALDYNNDLVGAAGLAGGMARLQRQNELNRLLAQYDVDEQSANASAQGDFTGQSLDLAKSLFGDETDRWKYQNDNQRYATEEMNDREYDLWKMSQGSSGSGKAPILSRASAITKTLNDLGITEPPPSGSQERADFNKIVRGYEGYRF
jgi:hypothetical protein